MSALQSFELQMKTSKTPTDDLAYTNRVYFDKRDLEKFNSAASSIGAWVQINEHSVSGGNPVLPGFIGFNSIHRRYLELGLGQPVSVTPYHPSGNNFYVSTMSCAVDFLSKSGRTVPTEFKAEEIAEEITKKFAGQFFRPTQRMVIKCKETNLEVVVTKVTVIDLESLKNNAVENPNKQETNKNKNEGREGSLGLLSAGMSKVLVSKAEGSQINLVGGDEMNQARGLFEPDWNFDNMGIGGLDTEFKGIFRRAFASRVFPPAVIQRLGINHVRGLLLYGPPGTGKTLMARQIGKMLKSREPKLVNGPDIYDKYVGEAERKIRDLFADAEAEWKQKGPNSELHIIIFDEIDAICKTRGSVRDNTGVSDTVVNQLLAKIDGVDSPNNFLVIGMTNRKDMLDPALLRPGRLEIQMEIGLPDEHGRQQILNIHTAHMRENKAMSPDVNLADLAHRTKNYSGSELAGLVRNATSYAFNRNINVKEGIELTTTDVTVTMDDFNHAVSEYKPAFGVASDDFDNCGKNGFFNFSSDIEKCLNVAQLIVNQVRSSDKTPLVSILLEGAVGCGKTTFAAKLAVESEYPMARMVSPDNLVGYSELAKANRIATIFEDAYRSALTILVLDDIERLLDYVSIGPRFSNAILQTLLVLLKKQPPKGRRLLIVGTTSNSEILEALELRRTFDKVISLPQIMNGKQMSQALLDLGFATSTEQMEKCEKLFVAPIAIKKLIMVAELANQGEPSQRFARLGSILKELADEQ